MISTCLQWRLHNVSSSIQNNLTCFSREFSKPNHSCIVCNSGQLEGKNCRFFLSLVNESRILNVEQSRFVALPLHYTSVRVCVLFLLVHRLWRTREWLKGQCIDLWCISWKRRAWLMALHSLSRASAKIQSSIAQNLYLMNFFFFFFASPRI